MQPHKRPLDNKDDTDLAACRAKRARLADELRQLDATIKRLSAAAGGASDDDDDNNPSCPDCQTGAVERTAKTEKNAGRKFWSCPKGCKTWIGWVGDNRPAKASKKEGDEGGYTCERCGRRLTVAAEVTLNMKRLGVPHFANDIRRELTRELEESMANGDYVCELCLGHN